MAVPCGSDVLPYEIIDEPHAHIPAVVGTVPAIPHSARWFRAHRRGDTLGAVRVERIGWTAEIRHLWVDEKYRESGIGRALFLAAQAWARNEGARVLTGTVYENSRLLAFYRKLGCEIIGSLFHPEEDRTITFLEKII